MCSEVPILRVFTLSPNRIIQRSETNVEKLNSECKMYRNRFIFQMRQENCAPTFNSEKNC